MKTLKNTLAWSICTPEGTRVLAPQHLEQCTAHNRVPLLRPRFDHAVGKLRNIVRLCSVFLSIVVSNMGAAGAFSIDYLPLTDAELSLRFKQHLLCDPLMPGNSCKTSSYTIRLSKDSVLQLSGLDVSAKAWSVNAACTAGYASVWTSDLDRNGKEDLLFVSSSPRDGWQPTSQLLIVLFDKDGRPVPWQMFGYFEVDSRGVKDILDLDENGMADVLTQSFSGGFWSTSLYETVAGRVKERAQHGYRTFPIQTKFTYKPNRLPSKRRPQSGFCNSNEASESTTISRVLCPSKPIGSTSIVFANGRSLSEKQANSVCVVLDEPAGRRAAFLPLLACRSLLEEIKARQMPVQAPKKAKAPSVVLWASRSQSANPISIARTAHCSDRYLTDELP